MPLTRVESTVNAIVRQSAAAGGLLVALIGGLLLAALRALLRPLVGLASAVRDIAAGALDRPPPCVDRADQFGEIGRAVQVLREAALQARRLEAEAAAEQQARNRRHEAMEQLTQDFGTTVSGVLTKLGGSAAEMRGAAGQMTEAAGRTRRDMSKSVQDADTSSRSLATVALATEELTASVGEISRQVAHAAQAAGLAVERARGTDATVQGLNNAAAEISEAGKGFAVVASEAKALAAQTTRATEQIGAQVGAIQAATGEAVPAVASVVTAIDQVGEVATQIAAAVEQQGTATRDIAAQVQQVAHSTEAAAAAMHEAAATAHRLEAASGSVLGAADQVAGVSTTLRDEVNHFLAAMRTAQTKGGQHRYERVPGRGARAFLRCSTHGSGTVHLRDISLAGASLACTWPCDVGVEVLITLPGTEEPATARIVDSRDGLLRVAFRQDPGTLARVRRAIEAILGTAGEVAERIAA